MANSVQEQFKIEFKELLEKYNAEISAEYDEEVGMVNAMVVDLNDKEVIRINDCSISKWDIK
jgi:hypothetical protein